MWKKNRQNEDNVKSKTRFSWIGLIFFYKNDDGKPCLSFRPKKSSAIYFAKIGPNFMPKTLGFGMIF